jgi:hypothetical protein
MHSSRGQSDQWVTPFPNLACSVGQNRGRMASSARQRLRKSLISIDAPSMPLGPPLRRRGSPRNQDIACSRAAILIVAKLE